jgi:prefoldin subunit 5
MADNQQREQEALNQPSKEVEELEEQLREVALAEQFLESATGKLFVKLATVEINSIVKDITSDKYRRDLTGYNNALADLNAYKKMLRKFQVAASPIRKDKLQERLDEKENA